MTDKKRIINRLIQYQKTLIGEIKKTIEGFQQEADLTEGEVKDPEDASFQNNSMDMRHSYQSRLNVAVNDLNKLETQTEIDTTEAVAGALIETDKVLFYLGIPTKPILLDDGRQLIGLSLDSEIASKLRSKRSGQSIPFGDSTLKIHHIQ